jgi:DNA-binding transcriptional ArsR family regulator
VFVSRRSATRFSFWRLAPPSYGAVMMRRLLLIGVGAAAALLVPWTAYLAVTLPDEHSDSQWRLAWVGFDVALLACCAAGAWLGLRRRAAAIPVLAATTALLCCDAWFDVLFDWSRPDRWVSVAMAALVELPFAGVLALRAKQMLTGGMPIRQLTARDIELQTDPSCQRVGRALDELEPATVDQLAAAAKLPAEQVRTVLGRLQNGGYARRQRDGRWRGPGPLSLRLPVLSDVAAADRSRVAAFLDAKFDRELRLLTWASRHRDEFGGWGKGERARAHLTRAELDSLEAEYRDLLTRYCLLHDGPAPGTQEMAIRFYAFPIREFGEELGDEFAEEQSGPG